MPRPSLRFLIDESVPDSVGRVLEEAGHAVIYLNRSTSRGATDQVVCALADAENCILVAIDGDMARIARGQGTTRAHVLQAGLIKLSCREAQAATHWRRAVRHRTRMVCSERCRPPAIMDRNSDGIDPDISMTYFALAGRTAIFPREIGRANFLGAFL